MGTIRIGLSGWSYDEWRGDVHPDDIAREDMLAHVSRQVDTIEVNAGFRRLLSPDTSPPTPRRNGHSWRS